jgi:hypothetical protein
MASQDMQLYGGGFYSPYNPGAHQSLPRFMDGPMQDDGNPIGGESVVTVINLRRAHSPHSGIQPSDKPVSTQESEPNAFNSRVPKLNTQVIGAGSRAASPKCNR